MPNTLFGLPLLQTRPAQMQIPATCASGLSIIPGIKDHGESSGDRSIWSLGRNKTINDQTFFIDLHTRVMANAGFAANAQDHQIQLSSATWVRLDGDCTTLQRLRICHMMPLYYGVCVLGGGGDGEGSRLSRQRVAQWRDVFVYLSNCGGGMNSSQYLLNPRGSNLVAANHSPQWGPLGDGGVAFVFVGGSGILVSLLTVPLRPLPRQH